MSDKRSRKYISILPVLLLFIVVFLLFGHYKEYLYEDEVLSFTAANCQVGMRPAFPLNTIVNGKEFVDNAITVSPDRRFDFKNAIGNTSGDPHPPVYPVLLHFVCSLFPGVFSKWFGLAINLIFGAVTVTLLFLLAQELLPGKGWAVSMAYALSSGAVTQFMNLRMYVVLQAFTTLLTLQYVMLLKKEGEGKEKLFNGKTAVFFVINVILGTMTHYYFLIFAFFEAAVFSLFLLMKKRYRDLFKHVLMYVVSGGLTLLIFPPIIWQLTGSDVGEGSFMKRDPQEMMRRGRVMLFNLNNELFGGQLKLFILALILWLLFLCCRGYKGGRSGGIKEEIKGYLRNFDIAMVFLILTAAFYFLTVSVTTPYLTGRYLSPVFPLVILIIFGAFLPAVREIFRSETVGAAFLVIILAVPLYLQISNGLFDENKAAMQELSKAHSGDICVFFRGISAEENYFELKNYESVMSLKLKPEEDAEEGDIKALSSAEELVVYIPAERDEQKYFDRIREYAPCLSETERLYRAYYSDAWLMHERK